MKELCGSNGFSGPNSLQEILDSAEHVSWTGDGGVVGGRRSLCFAAAALGNVPDFRLLSAERALGLPGKSVKTPEGMRAGLKVAQKHSDKRRRRAPVLMRVCGPEEVEKTEGAIGWRSTRSSACYRLA